MSERNLPSEEEKKNSTAIGDDPESLRSLEASLERRIDQMDFSEFADEEEDWGLFRDKKKSDHGEEPETASGNRGKKRKWIFLGKDAPEITKDEETEQREDDLSVDASVPDEHDLDEDKADDFTREKYDADDDRDSSDDEESDDEDSDDEDADYLRSAAYRRRRSRTLTYEQREARRVRRIERFWGLIEQNRKQIRWGLVGVMVIAALSAVSIVSTRWTYHSIEELVVSDKEDTLSVSYANANGRVLKYGADSAMLVDRNNAMLWTISYEMNNPEVSLCGETFVIYDSSGTSMRICGRDGLVGEVSTDLPIARAEVSEQGVVAAILEGGQNTWIKLYGPDGTEIATLKTTFAQPGYPVDIGLSENGNLLAVSFLYLDNGTPVSRISFYNFGTVGQNQRDNLVAEVEYRDQIAPEAVYMDEQTCVIFREDGFSVFEGAQIPAESVSVDTEENIVSTFHDSEYIGLVFRNRNSEKDYMICLYNRKGREILRVETDFRYQNIELNEGQIILSSKDELCVYNLQGVEKYRGSLEIPARALLGFGRNKFIYVSEDLFRIVRLG